MLQNLSKSKFYQLIQQDLGSLNTKQVAAIEYLLNNMITDAKIADIRQFAYMLATVKHETADTYLPIKEYGKGKGRVYGKPHVKTGHVYYGRGYVQLTWHDNYVKMGKMLNIDLENDPELALEPDTAYKIMSMGMALGTFTGKKLLDYINPRNCDYIRSRKIINGTDKAKKIAEYAVKFEKALRG